MAGLHLILAAKAPGARVVGPYLAGPLEALAGDVPWRLSLVADPDTDPPEVRPLARRTLPSPDALAAEPVQPLRWASRVQAGRPAFHSGPSKALLPAAQEVFASLVERGVDHRYALHVRSSQALALNLFAALDAAGRRSVLQLAGFDVESADPAVFEWRLDLPARIRRRSTSCSAVARPATSVSPP
ncbi:MAG: hypothetical protein ACRD03_10355 [Acidimicrobiales bacterium]